MARVLFFSPYAKWTYHTALEVTWAHALELRGDQVQFVLCNGLSGTCDIYRETINPRPANACLTCQASVAGLFANLGRPYDWLGTYLPLRAREKAQAWSQRLPLDQLLDARWRGMEVGRWAATSACNQFRTAQLQLSDPKVERSVRELLAGTVIVIEAMDALLDHQRPDTLAMLNGRWYGHWAAIELAKLKGIRFVTHERGFQADSVRMVAGSRTHDLDALRAIWEQWRDVPLDPIEVHEVATVLDDRRQGRNFSRLAFSPPVQERERVRAQLGLDGRPLVAVFNSSDDETSAFPERRAGAFPESTDFLPAVLELARSRPEVQFVIRVHPNIQKDRAGTNADALIHAEQVRAQAPENLRVVMPQEEISSYTLVDLADVGIVYASTIGLELAVCGTPVLCMAQATYSHAGCVRQVDAPEDLGPALDEALSRGNDPEVARVALRWAFRYFRECSIPFDLVHGVDDEQSELRYKHIGELAEGRHDTLDRICRFFEGAQDTVLPGPTTEERERSVELERSAVARWLELVQSGALGGQTV